MAETLDPKSLILSHFSDPMNPRNTLQLITDPYYIERGPRYSEYAHLRESKLRSKRIKLAEEEQVLKIPKSEFSPLKKTVRFQETFQGNNTKKQEYSVLAKSVPDFSSVIRKENRKPSENRVPRIEKSATPPPSMSKREKMYGSGMAYGGGSKSVNSGEKQSGGKLMMMGRKSYASIEELKGLSIAASNAINGENRGSKRRGGSVLRKSTVFSSRYY